MTYKFANYQNGSIIKHEFITYEEAQAWVDKKIQEYKVINRVKDEFKDRAFKFYKDELQMHLESQKVNKAQVMEDYLECKTCAKEEHEGAFCRCEMRNIRIAKEQRNRGESWKPLQRERLNPEAAKNGFDSPNKANI